MEHTPLSDLNQYFPPKNSQNSQNPKNSAADQCRMIHEIFITKILPKALPLIIFIDHNFSLRNNNFDDDQLCHNFFLGLLKKIDHGYCECYSYGSIIRFGQRNHQDALSFMRKFLTKGFEVLLGEFDALQAAREFTVVLKGAFMEVFESDRFWQCPGQDLGILLGDTGGTQTKRMVGINIKFVVDSLMDIDRHSIFRRVLIHRAKRQTCEYIWGFMAAPSDTPFWLLG
jgi:hypothetical protein